MWRHDQRRVLRPLCPSDPVAFRAAASAGAGSAQCSEVSFLDVVEAHVQAGSAKLSPRPPVGRSRKAASTQFVECPRRSP
eukprot:9353238-Pyramimonas_sp.AAC.1